MPHIGYQFHNFSDYRRICGYYTHVESITTRMAKDVKYGSRKDHHDGEFDQNTRFQCPFVQRRSVLRDWLRVEIAESA